MTWKHVSAEDQATVVTAMETLYDQLAPDFLDEVSAEMSQGDLQELVSNLWDDHIFSNMEEESQIWDFFDEDDEDACEELFDQAENHFFYVLLKDRLPAEVYEKLALAEEASDLRFKS